MPLPVRYRPNQFCSSNGFRKYFHTAFQELYGVISVKSKNCRAKLFLKYLITYKFRRNIYPLEHYWSTCQFVWGQLIQMFNLNQCTKVVLKLTALNLNKTIIFSLRNTVLTLITSNKSLNNLNNLTPLISSAPPEA